MTPYATLAEFASVAGVQEQLGMKNGVLFAAPIPEKYHHVGETIQRAVETAVQEAEENGMSRRGKEVTPWILKRVGELSGGKSLLSSALLCPCGSLALTSTYDVFSDVALIENTSLIGTLLIQVPLKHVQLYILRWSNCRFVCKARG